MVGATGKVTFLDGPPGTPLGAGGTDFRTEEVPLPPGSLLALYTDGLIEARYRDLDQGLEQLARALGQPARPLEQLCDEILERLLPHGPAGRRGGAPGPHGRPVGPRPGQTPRHQASPSSSSRSKVSAASGSAPPSVSGSSAQMTFPRSV